MSAANGAPAEAGAPARGGRARAAVVSGVLAALYAAAIFWQSSQANPFPFVPRPLLSSDKLLHAAGYAVLGFLVRVAVAPLLRGRRAFVVALLVAAAYGATDEWHQSFVPNRQADVLDWVADAVGALGGAALAAAFLRRRGDAG